MIIRDAREADLPALIDVGKKFFKYNPYRIASSLDEKSLEQTLLQLIKDAKVLIAEVGGKLAGCCGVLMAPCYWNFTDLQALEAFWWVEPEYRNTSIGTSLRVAMEARAKEKGAKFWIMVAMEDSMPDVVGAAYERAGLKVVEHTYMKVIK